MNLSKSLAMLFFALFLTACPSNDTPVVPVDDSHLATKMTGVPTNEWLRLSLELSENSSGFSPMVAARAFGYSGLVAYECVVGGIPQNSSFAGKIDGFNSPVLPEQGLDYNWILVQNSGMRTLFKFLYRNFLNDTENLYVNLRTDSLYNSILERYSKDVPQDVIDRSVALGIQISENICDYSKTDGQEFASVRNFPNSYNVPSGWGKWRPTPPFYPPALQPYWGDVRTFLPNHASITQPVPPPAYSDDDNSEFMQDLLGMWDKCVNANDEEKIIASFWNDEPDYSSTPPGHSMSILGIAIEMKNSNLAFASEAYARLGMALHDAFVACWLTKYNYNLIRPVTVIRDLKDPRFSPYLRTPPFPEYPSGHSVNSGAMAAVLTTMFGDNFVFEDKTHAHRNRFWSAPRKFNSFLAAAEEAAISRYYGGIHYKFAIEEGVAQGQRVGMNIMSINLKK